MKDVCNNFYQNESIIIEGNIQSPINNPNSIRSNSQVRESIISMRNEAYGTGFPNKRSGFNKSNNANNNDEMKKQKGNHLSPNNITYIQQNIYCSPLDDMRQLNNINENCSSTYDYNNNNQTNGNNPKKLNSQTNQDKDEEKTKILNTYFSELKDSNHAVNTSSNSILHMKSFLIYTRKNKITSYPDLIGPLSGISAFTYKNQKQYNEDKIGIIINSIKDNHKISFYSIFDGHGGTDSADYLKENLHLEIMSHHQLFTDTRFAILSSISKIEEQLTIEFKNKLNSTKDKTVIDSNNNKSSGSCAVVLVTIDDMITVFNVGDSRAILSMNNGSKVYSLTIDHNPSLENERVRIIQNGGEIKGDPRSNKSTSTKRVFPGGLAITRSIGDIEAKLPSCGGKPNVIIGVPDIITFKTRKDFDFIILGCDGIYGKISNREICLIVYQTAIKCIDKLFSYEQLLQKCTINIMKEAINKGSKDNLSCVFLCFESFKMLFETKNKERIEEAIGLLSRNGMECDNLYGEIESEYFIWKDTKKMVSQKTGMNFKQKSILNSNNIQLNTSKLSFEDSNNSDKSDKQNIKHHESNKNKKKKSKGSAWTCCGLFP